MKDEETLDDLITKEGVKIMHECLVDGCSREFGTKIGLGVHLVRSHTIQERGQHRMACLMVVLLLMFTIVVLTGICELVRR